MKINSKQLLFILENTPSSQNIMLMGKHGIGKSRILEAYFEKKGAKVVTLFLGQMSDPGDLIGLPEKNEKTGKTDFMLPYWFPLDDQPIVLFLDELNRARPEVLQTVMDLTLNRKLAGKSLPKGSRIISAVNNGSEYQLTDLDPALVSRFNIYEFAPSIEDWINWAESPDGNIDERIIAFIKENPEFLDGFDDNHNGSFSDSDLHRSPDRRSWERVSEVLSPYTADIFEKNVSQLRSLISGIIGDKTVTEFFEYINKNSGLSAKKLLTGDFSSNEQVLRQFGIAEITRLNNGIFTYLEGILSKNPENSLDKRISDNLNKYFDLLPILSKEYQMHFISLCSAQVYPNALAFIVEECGDLHKRILSSIK